MHPMIADALRLHSPLRTCSFDPSVLRVGKAYRINVAQDGIFMGHTGQNLSFGVYSDSEKKLVTQEIPLRQLMMGERRIINTDGTTIPELFTHATFHRNTESAVVGNAYWVHLKTAEMSKPFDGHAILNRVDTQSITLLSADKDQAMCVTEILVSLLRLPTTEFMLWKLCGGPIEEVAIGEDREFVPRMPK